MIALLWFVLAILASPFKSKSWLEAENVALRHQLVVLRRQVRGRVRLSNNDRWFFVQLYRCFPSILTDADDQSFTSGPRFTISLKRRTQNLQPSISCRPITPSNEVVRHAPALPAIEAGKGRQRQGVGIDIGRNFRDAEGNCRSGNFLQWLEVGKLLRCTRAKEHNELAGRSLGWQNELEQFASSLPMH